MSNIRPFLDLSTAHLDAASKRWLSNEARDAGSYEGCYGWFTCAYRDPDEPGSIIHDADRPAVLAAILQHAASLGCDYVLFDADAEESEALPVFEEED
jgi:hypothetical protein